MSMKRLLLPLAFAVVSALATAADPCPGFTSATGTSSKIPAGVDPVRLQRLRDVFQSVAAAARLTPRLGLCPDPRPNAFASPEPNTVSVTTGMLEIAGDSPDMLAAVLGHELGHLQRQHHLQRALRARQAGLVAARNGKDAALDFFFSFSREQEMDADDVGTKRLAEAGFNPEGSLQLFEAMRRKLGDKASGYLDSHPGFAERIARLKPRVMNEQRFRVAKGLYGRGDWQQLKAEVADWLELLPTFGEPWYFKGLLADRMGRLDSVVAFEKAVGFEPELSDAWFRLCLGLYREGHAWESAQCSRRLPDALRERFAARAFRGRLLVGGDEPPPSALAVVVAPNGQTMLTNDRGLLSGWGLGDETLPPAWMAIRPRPALAAGKPAPAWPRSDPAAGEAAFADLRAQCRPPLCLRR